MKLLLVLAVLVYFLEDPCEAHASVSLDIEALNCLLNELV